MTTSCICKNLILKYFAEIEVETKLTFDIGLAQLDNTASICRLLLLFYSPFYFCLCLSIFHMPENSGQQLVEAKVEHKTYQMISSIRKSNNTGRTSRLATGNALATKWSACFGCERLEAKFKLFTILVLTMSFRFVPMTTMQHSLLSLSLSLSLCHTANIIVFTFIDILFYFLTCGISLCLVSNPAWSKFDRAQRSRTESYKSFNVVQNRMKIH